MLPRISSSNNYNSWDVIGDYRRPVYLFKQSHLRISGDSLFGIINQANPLLPPPNPTNIVYRAAYNDLKYFMLSNQNDCRPVKPNTFDYKPIPESKIKWIEENYTWGFISPPICYRKQYEANGDTMFGQKTYIKLNITTSQKDSCNATNITYPVLKRCCNYYRNDSINRLVYFADSPGLEDTLYDFNLHVGSHIKIFHSFWNGPRVDSIRFQLINGKYHRTYYYQNLLGTQQLIEGVGKTDGLFQRINTNNSQADYSVTLCVNHDGNTLYPEKNTTCSLNMSTYLPNEPKSLKSNIQFIPNPVNRVLHLIGSDISYKQIRIYSMDGKLLQELDPKANKWILNPYQGLILIESQTIDNQFYFYKMIKQ
jgi:hypothetical protein